MTTRQNMLWRVPLVIAIITFLFWGTWWLIAGSVPEITAIKWTKTESLSLPFAVSRWWDTLFVPLGAWIIAFLFSSKRINKNENLGFDLGVGLIVGLGISLCAGLIVGLIVSLCAGLGAGLGAGLDAGLIVGLGVGLIFGLGAGLGASLGAGLIFGLGASLGAGLKLFWKGVIFIFSKKFSQWLAGH